MPSIRSLAICFLVANAAFSEDKPVEETDLFVAGQGEYHTYRIPAIVTSNKGTLLAFCEGRKEGRSDAGNIDLVVSRSTDNGTTWSKPTVVWNDGVNTCGNPCPVVDRQTGTIWLPVTWNLGSDDERKIMAGKSERGRRVYLTSSHDDGLTWGQPIDITENVKLPHWRWYATGPGIGIQLTRGPHRGRLIVPANHSDHTDPDLHPYRSHVFYSDNGGQTWQLGGVHEPRTNESQVAELAEGHLLQAMRSYHGTNRRALSTSIDGGKSWGELQLHESLDTPVCQASLLRYASQNQHRGKALLFASPRGKGRNHLTVWLSRDEGKTWPVSKEIYAGSAAYSCLVALPNNQVGLLYEKDGYQKIVLAKFDLAWLE